MAKTSPNSSAVRPEATWLDPEGKPVSCIEKLKVLEENLDEFKAMALEFLEDASLMGCDMDIVRKVLKDAVDSLPNPYED